jgi:hypothetical protein
MNGNMRGITVLSRHSKGIFYSFTYLKGSRLRRLLDHGTMVPRSRRRCSQRGGAAS